MSRLGAQPGERITRTKKVSFTFDGKGAKAGGIASLISSIVIQSIPIAA